MSFSSDFSISPTDETRHSSSPDQNQPPTPTAQKLEPLTFTPEQRRLSSSFDSATQQAILQAYFQAIRKGQVAMPSVAPPAASAKPQGNHSRTISDAKGGVTYVGQDKLQKLPIPTLQETGKRYLESVKPFLVAF